MMAAIVHIIMFLLLAAIFFLALTSIHPLLRLQGDDYILYCHPSRQKTPRSDRLRAWYHDMLRRAREEGNVAHVSTLWDSFFDGGRESRPAVEGGKCSAMQIPYLDGDYWPGEAENVLAKIEVGA